MLACFCWWSLPWVFNEDGWSHLHGHPQGWRWHPLHCWPHSQGVYTLSHQRIVDLKKNYTGCLKNVWLEWSSKAQHIFMTVDRLGVGISFIICTLVECKSGYGLDAENEIKMLKVITRAAREHNIGIVSTFLGAHAVPRDKTVEEGYQCIIQEMIPQIVELREKGELQVDFIDISFFPYKVFDVSFIFVRFLWEWRVRCWLHEKDSTEGQGERIQDLLPCWWAFCPFWCWDGSWIGSYQHEVFSRGNLQVFNSHLEEITEQGILDMAKSKSVACLLPSTAYEWMPEWVSVGSFFVLLLLLLVRWSKTTFPLLSLPITIPTLTACLCLILWAYFAWILNFSH